MTFCFVYIVHEYTLASVFKFNETAKSDEPKVFPSTTHSLCRCPSLCGTILIPLSLFPTRWDNVPHCDYESLTFTQCMEAWRMLGPSEKEALQTLVDLVETTTKKNELSDYGGKCSLCLSLVKIVLHIHTRSNMAWSDTVYMSQLMKLSHMAKREMCEDLWMHPYWNTTTLRSSWNKQEYKNK